MIVYSASKEVNYGCHHRPRTELTFQKVVENQIRSTTLWRHVGDSIGDPEMPDLELIQTSQVKVWGGELL